MAQMCVFRPQICAKSSSRQKNNWKTLIFARALALYLLAFAAGSLAMSTAAYGQTQQPFLIAIPSGANRHGAVTFVRDDTTGLLSAIPNTTVTFQNPCDPYTAEPKYRFLFGNCNGGLSMYTLDASTGVVAEVPNSPFTETTTNSAAVIMAEATGQYVYIVKANFSGSISGSNFSLDTFKIDPLTPALVPTSTQTLPIVGAWVDSGAIGDPNGHGFALLVNQDQGGSQPVPALYTVTFDPASGLPIMPASGTNIAGTNAQSIHIGPKGKFMAVNFGPNSEFLNVYQLSASTFQPLGMVSANIGSVPFSLRGIFSDPGDSLTYVQTLNTGTGEFTDFRILDSATLVELPSSPISFESAADIQTGIQDPYGPFVFSAFYPNGSSTSAGISVFQVDPITGVPSQPVPISSPQFPNLSVVPVLVTATSSQQNSSTPVIAWSPASLIFSSTQTGQSSGPQLLTLKNIGSLSVSFTSIALSGANATDFSLTDQCTPAVILKPNDMCTISVTYAPAAAGTSEATITVTDNAAGSPQMISLTGTAVAPPPPVPAVSLSPSGSLTFSGTTTQGTSGTPESIILTNTGTGPLHVTSIAVSGFNANDFIVGNSSCLGTVAPSKNCAIPVTFAPLAAGIRTTTLEITDDASDSPQSVALSGTATPAITVVPAPNGSTTATVTPGQPAQYNLQLTPGAGYTGLVSFTCSGAPLGATCQAPSSLQISNGNTAPFTVTVTTSGGALALPQRYNPPAATLFLVLMMVLSAFSAILLLFLLAFGLSTKLAQPRARVALAGLSAVMILLATLNVTGCGGGTAAIQPPPPIVTPQGTSTITVTPTAMSTSGKPLQLQIIQLTLTVN